jgi:hypothetical protein
MKRKHTLLKVGLVGVAGLLLPLVGAGRAVADYAPGPGDVVGIGGDTPQFAAEFAADGDLAGDAGWNTSGSYNKLVAFLATADGNGHASYAVGSTLAAPIAGNPTVTLRAGTAPVLRNTSSGSSITALLADTSKQVNYVFSTTAPTAAQQTTAGNSTHNWGFLHVTQIGTDSIDIAAVNIPASGSNPAVVSNAPAGLSVTDLVNIYDGTWTTWGQVPGYSATHTSAQDSATIVPLLPPSSSTLTSTLLKALTAADLPNTFAFAGTTQVEQNDPTAITSLPATQEVNAIVPFSAARLSLWNSGYFHAPTSSVSAGAVLTPGVSLLTATADGNGTAAWTGAIDAYIIFRQTDLTSNSTPFEPGSSLNWAEALFSNPSNPSAQPYFENFGAADIAAAGFTPSYVDHNTAFSIG